MDEIGRHFVTPKREPNAYFVVCTVFTFGTLVWTRDIKFDTKT